MNTKSLIQVEGRVEPIHIPSSSLKAICSSGPAAVHPLNLVPGFILESGIRNQERGGKIFETTQKFLLRSLLSQYIFL